MKWAILSVLAVLLLAACQPSQVVVNQQGQQTNVISVSGMSEFEVSPDKAVIRVRIENLAPTAQESQNANRAASNSVMDALMRFGIRKDQIETYNYNVYREQVWNAERQENVDRGYRVQNSFKITTDRLTDVGAILDTAIQAGANNVEGISFELSEKRQADARTEALKMAANNAREKAQALASGLGVPLGRLVTVQEQSFNVYPMAARGGYDMAESMMVKAMPPTPVEPQSVQVSAQVSVSYDIGGQV